MGTWYDGQSSLASHTKSPNKPQGEDGLVINSGAAVLERLREVSGCPTDAELGRRFKIAQSSISKWRARDAVPLAQALRIATLSNANADYVLTGTPKGTEFRQIYTVDQNIIFEILHALSLTGVLGDVANRADEQALKGLARRITGAYNQIENFAQDLFSAGKLPIEEAREVAMSSFKAFHRVNHPD
jgi:hypothetical protein